MADVFISYASQDRPLAERTANALTARGLEVWWDRDIRSGSNFRNTIERELAVATAVLVLWSPSAVASHWVCEEADAAVRTGKLVAARTQDLEPAAIPIGFRSFQTSPIDDVDRICQSVLAIKNGRTRMPPQATVPSNPRSTWRHVLVASLALAGMIGAAAFVLAPLIEEWWQAPAGDAVTLAEQLRVSFEGATRGQQPPLPEERFGHVRQVLQRMEKLDRANGHVYYYHATMTRWLARDLDERMRSHRDFYKYMELADAAAVLNAATDDGSAAVCYQRPTGFCKQRTAYVQHTLAYDFLQRAEQASDPRQKIDAYRQASRYAALALVHEAQGEQNGGFIQGEPTYRIKERAETALDRLAQQAR